MKRIIIIENENNQSFVSYSLIDFQLFRVFFSAGGGWWRSVERYKNSKTIIIETTRRLYKAVDDEETFKNSVSFFSVSLCSWFLTRHTNVFFLFRYREHPQILTEKSKRRNPTTPTEVQNQVYSTSI